MKLTESEFIPEITEKGSLELMAYCQSILYKAGTSIPVKDQEDVISEMVLVCLEKLPSFNPQRGIPLGGFLYWQCRGAISKWANRNKREIPFEQPIVEWMKNR